MMNRCWLTVVLILISARVGTAQTTPAVFVTGGVLSSIERYSHATYTPLSPSALTFPDLSGTVPGGSIGVGAHLTSRISVRAEFAFRGSLDGQSSATETLGILPPVSFTETITVSDRNNSGAVLLAYHASPAKRVNVEYLGGIAFARRRQEVVTEFTTSIPFPGAPPERREVNSTTYRTLAVVGVDVPVRITGRFAVVPQIRAHSDGGLTFRPGVSVRVSFL